MKVEGQERNEVNSTRMFFGLGTYLSETKSGEKNDTCLYKLKNRHRYIHLCFPSRQRMY